MGGNIDFGDHRREVHIFIQRLTFSGFLDFFVKLNYGGD